MSPGWTRPDGTRPRSASPGRLDCPARCPTDWDWPCGWKEQLVPVGPWLLLTSSGRGRIGRRLPRPRPNVLGGPYSSLLKYRIDGGHHLLTAFPRPVRRGPARGDLRSVREALAAEPLVLDLCTETTGQSWRPFAVLTVRASLLPRIRSESPAFDLHHPQLAKLDEREHTGKHDVLDAPGHESDR